MITKEIRQAIVAETLLSMIYHFLSQNENVEHLKLLVLSEKKDTAHHLSFWTSI